MKVLQLGPKAGLRWRSVTARTETSDKERPRGALSRGGTASGCLPRVAGPGQAHVSSAATRQRLLRLPRGTALAA